MAFGGKWPKGKWGPGPEIPHWRKDLLSVIKEIRTEIGNRCPPPSIYVITRKASRGGITFMGC